MSSKSIGRVQISTGTGKSRDCEIKVGDEGDVYVEVEGERTELVWKLGSGSVLSEGDFKDILQFQAVPFSVSVNIPHRQTEDGKD